MLDHPEMENQIDRLRETVLDPEEVRESVYDHSVWLFYRFYANTPVTEKYLVVTAKILNKEPFIVTAFFTDKMKKGGVIWRRKP